MYFRLLALGAVSALAVFSGDAVLATTSGECSSAAARLSLDVSLCNGQGSINRASLRRINDSDGLRRLGIALRRLGYLNWVRLF